MARRSIEPTTELGKRLEKERRNRELTKTAWVKVLETSRPTYDDWLHKPVEVQEINRRAIARELDVTPAEVDEWVRENLRLCVLGIATYIPALAA